MSVQKSREKGDAGARRATFLSTAILFLLFYACQLQ